MRNFGAIDVIAHHSIQAQSVEPFADELSRKYDIRFLVGPESTPSGAAAAVVTDHLVFQPNATKREYALLIHASHDIADIDVYHTERSRLRQFDLILAPGSAHAKAAARELPRVERRLVGWPKYGAEFPKPGQAPSRAGENLIVALTDVGKCDWRSLVDALAKSSFQITIKNHVYYDRDKGHPPPLGLEAEYKEHMRALEAMNQYLTDIRPPNFEIVDARTNICDLFPGADFLLTDWSSAAIEFLPFGISLEMGKKTEVFGQGMWESRRSNSALSQDVRFLPEYVLVQQISDWVGDDIRRLPKNDRAPMRWRDFCHQTLNSSAVTGATHIDELISSHPQSRTRSIRALLR